MIIKLFIQFTCINWLKEDIGMLFSLKGRIRRYKSKKPDDVGKSLGVNGGGHIAK